MQQQMDYQMYQLYNNPVQQYRTNNLQQMGYPSMVPLQLQQNIPENMIPIYIANQGYQQHNRVQTDTQYLQQDIKYQPTPQRPNRGQQKTTNNQYLQQDIEYQPPKQNKSLNQSKSNGSGDKKQKSNTLCKFGKKCQNRTNCLYKHIDINYCIKCMQESGNQKICTRCQKSEKLKAIIITGDQLKNIRIQPGKMIIVSIRIRNKNSYDWDENCYIKSIDNIDYNFPLVIDKICLYDQVKANSEIEVFIPINAQKNAQPTNEIHTVKMSLFDGQNNPFGLPFVIKAQIVSDNIIEMINDDIIKITLKIREKGIHSGFCFADTHKHITNAISDVIKGLKTPHQADHQATLAFLQGQKQERSISSTTSLAPRDLLNSQYEDLIDLNSQDNVQNISTNQYGEKNPYIDYDKPETTKQIIKQLIDSETDSQIDCTNQSSFSESDSYSSEEQNNNQMRDYHSII